MYKNIHKRGSFIFDEGILKYIYRPIKSERARNIRQI